MSSEISPEKEKYMKHKKALRAVVISILLLITAAALYFFQFTCYGYLMLLPCRLSVISIADGVYMNKNNTMSKEEILELIGQARDRVQAFYGDLQYEKETVIFICDDEKIIKRTGSGKDTCTFLFPQKKHYIVISNEYFNLDILSHEMTHAELHTRLTKNALENIPTWFDEGIAVQNDYREQYGKEAWIKQTDNGKNTVALEDMDAPSEFYAGTADDRRFRYLNAKHELTGWMETHQQEGLLELFDRLNNGEDFDTAYGLKG